MSYRAYYQYLKYHTGTSNTFVLWFCCCRRSNLVLSVAVAGGVRGMQPRAKLKSSMQENVSCISLQGIFRDHIAFHGRTKLRRQLCAFLVS